MDQQFIQNLKEIKEQIHQRLKSIESGEFDENEHRKISLHIVYEDEIGTQFKDVFTVFEQTETNI